MQQHNLLQALVIAFCIMLVLDNQSLGAMIALKNKQQQIATHQQEDAAAKLAKPHKEPPIKASLRQLHLQREDLQTRATCGTCDLFLAYAIDQILRMHQELNAQTMHTRLTALGYGSCIMTCKVNIEAEEFTETLIKDLKIDKKEADEILTRIFALGYRVEEGVFPTTTHPYAEGDFDKLQAIPDTLANLSLKLRRGEIPAVHFICNVGATTTHWDAYHWVLFSVVNSGGVITLWYIDSDGNTPYQAHQPSAPAYINYIALHMGLSLQ